MVRKQDASKSKQRPQIVEAHSSTRPRLKEIKYQ